MVNIIDLIVLEKTKSNQVGQVVQLKYYMWYGKTQNRTRVIGYTKSLVILKVDQGHIGGSVDYTSDS